MQIYAVDFDGTIVEHKYPLIGDELPLALKTLSELQERGDKVIIWTCRSGDKLLYMMDWFNKHNFKPDAVNSNYSAKYWDATPKIYADLYIDDRNIGGFIGWSKIREILGLK